MESNNKLLVAEFCDCSHNLELISCMYIFYRSICLFSTCQQPSSSFFCFLLYWFIIFFKLGAFFFVSPLCGLKIQDQQQGGVTDEAEPFMGSGRFGTDYLLYHNWPSSCDLFSYIAFKVCLCIS